MSMKIEIPFGTNSYVYLAVKDKRVKQPHKCQVVGYWISADPNRSEIRLVHYNGSQFDYCLSLPLNEIDGVLFENEELASKAMNERK